MLLALIGFPTAAIVAALGLALGTYRDQVPHATLVRAVLLVAVSCIATGALCLALAWVGW
ncbi:hypothetical protein [Streptomyces violascens]|uniref:Uncharacterized protein n=1 Tax=Streptomyces violascens TaxID=67381 RepID=A0ABQ3QXB3_9ACTN|nr:hypothetical protein [Streptomyces violascens]GGU13132.1 hypothetical protein GCM10010289_38470 [Streptomyces violascens]GHI41897.1 hypothetical protein Sviol_63050 [Streptomyces violascens]